MMLKSKNTSLEEVMKLWTINMSFAIIILFIKEIIKISFCIFFFLP